MPVSKRKRKKKKQMEQHKAKSDELKVLGDQVKQFRTERKNDKNAHRRIPIKSAYHYEENKEENVHAHYRKEGTVKQSPEEGCEESIEIENSSDAEVQSEMEYSEDEFLLPNLTEEKEIYESEKVNVMKKESDNQHQEGIRVSQQKLEESKLQKNKKGTIKKSDEPNINVEAREESMNSSSGDESILAYDVSWEEPKVNTSKETPMRTKQKNVKEEYPSSYKNEEKLTYSSEESSKLSSNEEEERPLRFPVGTKFDVPITYSQWKTIKPKSSRPNICQSSWTELLSSEVNKVIPECVLAFERHRINVKRKRSTLGINYFNATGHCKHENCGKFKFSIEEKPIRIKGESVVVSMEVISNVINHRAGDIRKRSLKAVRRKKFKKMMENKSASRLHFEKFGKMENKEIKSGNYTKCQSAEVLRKAKSEGNLNEIVHKDPFTAFVIVRNFLRAIEEQKDVNGYVQEISYDPFMVTLFKEESLTIARNNIKNRDGVFYFDATGSLVRNIFEKKVLYYALVVGGQKTSHDKKGGPPCPVLEFLSERQSALYIMRPVQHFLSELEKMSKFNKPKRVECDFSWAIIHAVCLACNKFDIPHYLQKCHSFVLNPDNDRNVTVIHLCAHHMLKAVQNQLKEKSKIKEQRELGLRLFAVLQNCSTVDQTQAVWQTICIVMGSKFINEDVIRHQEQMKEIVKEASPNVAELICGEDWSLQADTSEMENSKGIRYSSPFYRMYSQFVLPEEDEDDENLYENPYYWPQFVILLSEKYLPLIPLWSGLMLENISDIKGRNTGSTEQSIITRDSNANVENWMKIIKHDSLGGKKKLPLDIFINTVYKILLGRLASHLQMSGKVTKKRKKGKEESKKNIHTEDEVYAEESWQRKQTYGVPKKSFYYTPPEKFPEPKLKKKPTSGKAKRHSHTSQGHLLGSGIRNIGNTCWLISSLQALSSLNELILKDYDSDVAIDTIEAVQKLKISKERIVNIDELKDSIRMNIPDFQPGVQQDAAEYLTHILSHVTSTEVNMMYDVQCLKCHEETRHPEIMTVLSIELPVAKEITVNDCIKEFTKTEAITGSEEVICRYCNRKANHVKQSKITKAGDVIIIQLKRYERRTDGRLHKNSKRITLNRLIAVGEFEVFRLCAVQCHIGHSLRAGHYTTVRVLDNGRILHFDDSMVTKEDYGYLNNQAVQESCYILFYSRIQVPNPYAGIANAHADDQNLFINSLYNLPRQYVIATHSNIVITMDDINTLFDGQWLNDQIINCYLGLVQRSCPFLMCVDTFFVEALLKKRDAKKLFGKVHLSSQTEKILIPSVYNSHWALLVLDLEDSTITVVDSGNAGKHEAIFTANLVHKFLTDEKVGKKEWKRPQIRKDVNKQSNTDDCGVFLCQNAVLEGVVSVIPCSQDNIHDIRIAMIMEIITGKLMQRRPEA